MGKYNRYILATGSFIIRHWLSIVNIAVFIFLIPIVATPYLISTGNPALVTLGNAFMMGYHATCHQWPERCLFVFGHQMTVCARCFAIYVSFLAGGLLFYLIRNRLKPFHILYYGLICVPMGIDGTLQLFGIPLPRGIGPGLQLIWTVESTNEIRLITGAIFGLGSALFVMPYMQKILELEEEDARKRSVETAGVGQSANRG